MNGVICTCFERRRVYDIEPQQWVVTALLICGWNCCQALQYPLLCSREKYFSITPETPKKHRRTAIMKSRKSTEKSEKEEIDQFWSLFVRRTWVHDFGVTEDGLKRDTEHVIRARKPLLLAQTVVRGALTVAVSERDGQQQCGVRRRMVCGHVNEKKGPEDEEISSIDSISTS